MSIRNIDNVFNANRKEFLHKEMGMANSVEIEASVSINDRKGALATVMDVDDLTAESIEMAFDRLRVAIIRYLNKEHGLNL